jgi:hypothetical protein
LDTSETLNGKKSLSYGAKTVSVEIRGYAAVSIKGGSTSGLLEVGQGVSLTLGNNITVDGTGLTLKNYAGLIEVNEGALKMVTGSKIMGLDAPMDCGAVIVGPLSTDKVSTFEMQGGEIRDNISSSGKPWEAPASNGAVLLRRKGQFTMSGGSITNNTRGVVIAGPEAYCTMKGGSITENGKIRQNGTVTDYASGMRGAGVCVGENLNQGTFTMEGGEIRGNGGPGQGSTLPPGGGVYVSSRNGTLILNGKVTIDQNNTVCLTSASSGQCPAITLKGGFTVSNPMITLDLAATQPKWVSGWIGKTVLKRDDGSSIANLKDRFKLGEQFYFSSGNNDFKPVGEPKLSGYKIDTDGTLVLRPPTE